MDAVSPVRFGERLTVLPGPQQREVAIFDLTTPRYMSRPTRLFDEALEHLRMSMKRLCFLRHTDLPMAEISKGQRENSTEGVDKIQSVGVGQGSWPWYTFLNI
jgi:hypothetical protein